MKARLNWKPEPKTMWHVSSFMITNSSASSATPCSSVIEDLNGKRSCFTIPRVMETDAGWSARDWLDRALLM